MKNCRLALLMVCLGIGSLPLAGCQTESPGTTYTVGSYSGMVDSTPDKVTQAARKAVEELKLLEINSSGTKVDGKVTAKTAQNDAVTIDVEKAGDNVSKVSIRVGTLGDEAMSKSIMDKIKGNLHWF